MNNAVVKINHLSKSFGQHEILHDLNAEIRQGEVIGLLGFNGAGKTTLLETALGFSPASDGNVELFAKDSFSGLDKTTKARIGFVPQGDELLQHIRVDRYLNLIAEFYPRWNKKLIERRCTEWLIPLDQKTEKLSVGQKQKLSILTALGHEPDLIILDEPVASLDTVARRQFLKELVDIADNQQRTIVFSTHIVSDLERVASRVWLLKDKRIAVDAELDSLKEKTVRVHLPPGISIPAYMLADSLIHCRQEQQTNVLVFTEWSPERHQELEKATGCSLQPEYLSLEDIFLELMQ